LETANQVNAKSMRLHLADSLALARDVDEIYVSKGKKVVHLNMKKDAPDESTLAALLLGPTGNLRAPILRKGRTLLVGFDESIYKKVLK
jgi:arsenate reductase-like glutaredoxin family protein